MSLTFTPFRVLMGSSVTLVDGSFAVVAREFRVLMGSSVTISVY